MAQINIRINKEEKTIMQAIADSLGISITETARKFIFDNISEFRVDLAFKLLHEHKIGRKKAMSLSGLNPHEFLLEWSKRGAEEILPDELVMKMTEDALEKDLSKYFKTKDISPTNL